MELLRQNNSSLLKAAFNTSILDDDDEDSKEGNAPLSHEGSLHGRHDSASQAHMEGK